MPPVTKAGGRQFRKAVEFVTKDDDVDEQIAAGIVMVPDKVDLQNDFVREETIRGFANQFEAFVDAGQAGGGVMHAVFPDDWMDLERNEVLDEAEEIGGTEAPTGAWIQEWSINHDELWELIQDEVIAGYSIGAVQVGWGGPYEQDADAVEDVTVPEEIGDELIWELVEGLIREVSAVDIPAVPDAQILERKSMDKRLGDHLGDPNAFVEEAMQRGHSEDDAGRLWAVLNDAVEVEGSGEPGKQSLFSRIGKAAVETFLGGDDTGDTAGSQEASMTSKSETASQAKAGQTLSKRNRHSLFAAVDSAADVLEDAGVDHGIERFTDREEYDFDLSEHTAREWPKPDEDDDEEAESGDHDDEDDEDEEDDKNASGGDNPDDNGSTEAATMTDTNENEGGDKSLAEKNAEQISELTAAVEGLTEAIPTEEKTAEIEVNGQIFEVTESEAKAWFDENGEAGDADGGSLKSEIETLKSRIDSITRNAGVGSDQLDAGGSGDDNDDSGLGGLGKALS